MEYTYDENGKLVKVDSPNEEFDAEYQFDGWNRIVTKNDLFSITHHHSYYPGSFRIKNSSTSAPDVTTEDYIYDGKGRVIYDRNRRQVVRYDYKDMPWRIETYDVDFPQSITWQEIINKNYDAQPSSILEYRYDEGGNRVLKLDESPNYLDFGEVTVGNGAVWRYNESSDQYYLHYLSQGGNARKVFYSNGSSDLLYLITDHQGSTRMVLNDQGTPAEIAMYTPYGAIVPSASYRSMPVAPKEQWQGKELDDAFWNQYYFGSRYFNSTLGMWLVPDPAGQFHNPYTYGGDPVNFVDPDGEFVSAILAGAVIGSVFGYLNGRAEGSSGFELVADILAGAAIGGTTAVFAGYSSTLFTGAALGSGFGVSTASVIGASAGGFVAGGISSGLYSVWDSKELGDFTFDLTSALISATTAGLIQYSVNTSGFGQSRIRLINPEIGLGSKGNEIFTLGYKGTLTFTPGDLIITSATTGGGIGDRRQNLYVGTTETLGGFGGKSNKWGSLLRNIGALGDDKGDFYDITLRNGKTVRENHQEHKDFNPFPDNQGNNDREKFEDRYPQPDFTYEPESSQNIF